MNVSELEAMIGAALRAADRPVDVAAGTAALRRHVAARRRARRRGAALVATAAILAAVVLPWSLSRHDAPDRLPVRPPTPTATAARTAPSGLPVGELRIPMTVTGTTGAGNAQNDAGTDTVHFELLLRVDADGSGQYKVVTSSDPSAAGFDVAFRRGAAPGEVEMVYNRQTCLTFSFTVASSSLRFDTARPGSCLVSAGTAAALVGQSTQVRPLPSG